MHLKDQERARNFLEKLHSSGKIPSSLLFYGPSGVGKTVCALEFSKGLLCFEDKPWGCGECLSCTRIDRLTDTILYGDRGKVSLFEEVNGRTVFLYLYGEHPDFVFVPPDGASLKIDQVRAVKSFAYRKPALSKRKVILMDDAHLMTRESANALLKVLEEPPENTHFILVSEGKESLLPTVVSRTYQVEFSPLDRQSFYELLGEENEYLYEASEGSLTLAKELKEKGNILRLLEEFLSLDPAKVYAVSQEMDKKEIGDKLLFLHLLEDRIGGAFLRKELDYDRFEAAMRSIEEIRVGLRRGLRFSLGLFNLYFIWR